MICNSKYWPCVWNRVVSGPSAPAWKYLLITDDLTSAGLCVTATEIGLTCGPAFYPESFSRLCKIAALGTRFLTYSLSYTPCLSFSCDCETNKQGQKLISLSIMSYHRSSLSLEKVLLDYSLDVNPACYVH